MKTIVLYLLCISVSFAGISQEMVFEKDEVSVKFIKAKKSANTFNLVSTSRITGNGLQKVMIKCKIKSMAKEKYIDFNKFSLVDHHNKLRYRPTDISSQIVAQYNIKKLLKSDVDLPGYYTFGNFSYQPEIRDTFTDFDINGYTNIEIPYVFRKGSKKQKKFTIYFHPSIYNIKAHFFFAIIEKAENPDFEFYYGNEKITDVEF